MALRSMLATILRLEAFLRQRQGRLAERFQTVIDLLGMGSDYLGDMIG